MKHQDPRVGSYHPHVAPAPEPASGLLSERKQPQQKSTENLLLNALLYVGALFIIGAAALILGSWSSVGIRLFLLAFTSLLFYGSGLLAYTFIPRLRLASYSFVATGLALIPLTGLAVYTLVWTANGGLLWLLTSLIGTAAVAGALALMPARIMGYLGISFLVSDFLAVPRTLEAGLLWYFISLLALGSLLQLLEHSFQRRLPSQLLASLRDMGSFVLPATMLAVLYCASWLKDGELALIFALGTLYSLVSMRFSLVRAYYLQARIYSPIAIYYGILYCFKQADPLGAPLTAVVLLLLLTALALQLLPQHSLPFPSSLDALVTWICSQPLFLLSLLLQYLKQATGLSLFSVFLDVRFSTLLIGLYAGLNYLVLALLLASKRPDLVFPLTCLGFITTWPLISTLSLAVLALALTVIVPLCQKRQTTGYYRFLSAGVYGLSALYLLATNLLALGPARPFTAIWFFAFLAVGLVCLTRSVDSGAKIIKALALTCLVIYSLLQYAFYTQNLVLLYTADWTPASTGHLVFIGISLVALWALLSLAVIDGVKANPGQIDLWLLYGLTAIYAFLSLFQFTPVIDSLVLVALLLPALLTISRADEQGRWHLLLAIRLQCLVLTFRLLSSSSISPLGRTLLVLFFLVLLSAISAALLYRRRENSSQISLADSERTIGIGLGALALFYATGKVFDSFWYENARAFPVISYTVALLLVLLLLAWQFAPSSMARVLQGSALPLIAYYALFLPVSYLIYGYFRYAAFPEQYLWTLCFLSSMAAAKILAALSSPVELTFQQRPPALSMPSSPQHTAGSPARHQVAPWARDLPPSPVPAPSTGLWAFQSIPQDPLGAWGAYYNRALCRTSYLISTVLLLPIALFADLLLASLTISITTFLWVLQVKPVHRLLVFILGFDILGVRIFLNYSSAYDWLYISQLLVLSTCSFILLSSLFQKADMLQLKSAYRSPYWVALSFQLLLTLPILASADFFPITLKLLVLLSDLALISLAALLKETAALYLSGGILTLHFLAIAGGFNPLTLLVAGLAIIALVTIRLLTRKE